MPGFPLLNLGTALGGLVKGYDQQQQDAQQRQLNVLLQQLRQQQLQQVVRDQKARQLLGALAGTPDAAGLFGAGGGQMPQPPMPGQASQPAGGSEGYTGPPVQNAVFSPPSPPSAPMPTGSVSSDLKTGSGDSEGGFSSPQERRAYYMRLADQRGISRSKLDQLVGSEGTWEGKTGDHGLSGGPMQDYMGGGLGNEYKAQTGYDPRDPSHGKELARFDIDQLAKRGFDPNTWHGLRRVGGGGGSAGAGAGGGDSGSMPRIAPPIYRPPPQGYDMNNLAAQLRKTNPGIDPETMFSALDQYQHLMDGPSKDAWERFKFETQEQRHDYEFQVGEQDKGYERQERGREFDLRQAELAETKAEARQQRDLALSKPEHLIDNDGTSYLAYPPTTPGAPPRYTTLDGKTPYEPQGFNKVGASKQSMLPELEYPDKWEGMPNKPPPGVRGDIWQSTIEYVRTGKMPAMGLGNSQVRNEIVRTAPAVAHALGMDPTKVADYQAAYAGERHGQIVGGGRAANIALGIREAEQAAPQVIQTSQAVPRTVFPTINNFTNWLSEKTGDPNIVAFRAALNTYLNVYASVVSRTGRLTDAQQNHAYDLLSTTMAEGQIERGIQQLNYEMELMQSAVPEAMEDLTKIGQPPALKGAPSPSIGGASAKGGAGLQEIPLPDPSIPESGVVKDVQGTYGPKDALWQRNGDKLRRLPPQ